MVVTGLGVVSPIGTGVLAFLDGLQRGRSGIGPIRSFDASAFASRLCGEVRDLPSEAREEDPALRRDPKACFGVVAAREALTASGLTAEIQGCSRSERRAAFIAAGLEIFHLEDLVACLRDGQVDGALLRDQFFLHPPLTRVQTPAHLGALRIAREAGAGGPLVVNLSACAASTQSIGDAFRALRQGAVDQCLAGGYDSMVNPLGVGGFCLLGALSSRNDLGSAASRPFHRQRDGFVLGEGAAFLVLETLDGARRRGAPVLAEIEGYASTLDAHRVTDPAPDQHGAEAAMRGALKDAGRAVQTVDFISAHGTGTPKNDPAETAAIRRVFGAHADRLAVPATKSQLGHLIGAAGAVELVAGILALRHGFVPATLNLTEPDPACDLDYVPLHPRSFQSRVFVKNSFGFGGQNACLVVSLPDEAQGPTT